MLQKSQAGERQPVVLMLGTDGMYGQVAVLNPEARAGLTRKVQVEQT